MRLVISQASVRNLEVLSMVGPRHDILGGFFDVGTYATVIDCDSSTAHVDALIAEFAALCHATPEVGFQAVASPIDIGPEAGIWRVATQQDVATDSPAIERLYSISGDGDAVTFILRDHDEGVPPMWLLASMVRPCYGLLSPCSRNDVVATWAALMGIEMPAGRDLCRERDSLDTASGERDLSARLKQLYGADY